MNLNSIFYMVGISLVGISLVGMYIKIIKEADKNWAHFFENKVT